MMKFNFNDKRLNDNFSLYINKFALVSDEEREFIEELLKKTDAFIFGGVISNYFLRFRRIIPKDIDIVISKMNVQIDNLLNEYLIRKNRFNGYKLKIKSMQYDIWKTEDTWTLYKNPILQKEDMEMFLPETVFFNITSCLYDLKKKQLLLPERFKNGINNRELSIINEDNPYPILCIVKSMEYRENFGLTFTDRLLWYIFRHKDKINRDECRIIQNGHYGYEKYSIGEINLFIREIEEYLKKASGKNVVKNQMELMDTTSHIKKNKESHNRGFY